MRSIAFVALPVASIWVVLAATARADSNPPYRSAEPILLADNSTVEQQRSQQQPAIAPPEPQQWAIGLAGLYTHREGETAGWAPSVEVDYTATDRLQLHLMMPFSYDRLNGGKTHFGLGDFELGARYRFVDDDPRGWQPSISVYPLVDLPTGSLEENLGTGRTHVFLPLWLSKAFGQWIPYGGGGYWINPGPLNKNWSFLSLGVVRVLSDSWSVNGEVFHADSSKVGLRAQTGFDVGAHYNMTASQHVIFTIGRGLQNASDTNEVSAYLAYVLTF